MSKSPATQSPLRENNLNIYRTLTLTHSTCPLVLFVGVCVWWVACIWNFGWNLLRPNDLLLHWLHDGNRTFIPSYYFVRLSLCTLSSSCLCVYILETMSICVHVRLSENSAPYFIYFVFVVSGFIYLLVYSILFETCPVHSNHATIHLSPVAVQWEHLYWDCLTLAHTHTYTGFIHFGGQTVINFESLLNNRRTATCVVGRTLKHTKKKNYRDERKTQTVVAKYSQYIIYMNAGDCVPLVCVRIRWQTSTGIPQSHAWFFCAAVCLPLPAQWWWWLSWCWPLYPSFGWLCSNGWMDGCGNSTGAGAAAAGRHAPLLHASHAFVRGTRECRHIIAPEAYSTVFGVRTTHTRPQHTKRHVV